MNGSFSDEALVQYISMLSARDSISFSESDTYDFARCVRPDGSSYGTKGKCRKGTESAAKAESGKGKGSLSRKASDVKAESLVKAVMNIYEKKHGGSAFGDDTALRRIKLYQRENPNATIKDAVKDVASDMWQDD
jgi:hypothetical protein